MSKTAGTVRPAVSNAFKKKLGNTTLQNAAGRLHSSNITFNDNDNQTAHNDNVRHAM